MKITGILTKDVVDLTNIFKYTDENGAEQTLPYAVDADRNISFVVTMIELEKQFENATTVSTEGSTALSATVDLLRDSNYISYLLFKVTNNTALSASTWYNQYFSNSIDELVDNNYYVIYIAKLEALSGDIVAYSLILKLKFYDEFANEREIWLRLGSSYDLYEDTSGALVHSQLASNSTIIQIKLDDVITSLGKSWTLTKLVEITYYLSFKTNTTLSSNYEIAAMIYTAIISQKEFKINDIVVNDTKTLEFKATKTITSTLEINKIADVSIPFEYIPEPERAFDANNFAAKYDWLFSLPDDDALIFSSVVANVTLGDLDDYTANISYFYVSGTDYKQTLQNQKYYSFAVSAGVQYYVSLKFEGLPESVYDSLIEISSPPTSGIIVQIEWYFGAFLVALGGLFGSYGLWIKRKGKEFQRKAKSKSLSK